MPFSVNFQENKLVKEAYESSMKELNEFFGLNWKKNLPRIFLVKDRRTIDALQSTKTPDWNVGWIAHGDVYLLDKENYEKESSHKYSDEEYSKLIKHELTHLFTQIISGVHNKPMLPKWLSEGISICLSEQTKSKKRPNKLSKFLSSYQKAEEGCYSESGFAVEYLLLNYGKEKLISLLKYLNSIESEEGFKSKFKEIYGFDLSYSNFNLS